MKPPKVAVVLELPRPPEDLQSFVAGPLLRLQRSSRPQDPGVALEGSSLCAGNSGEESQVSPYKISPSFAEMSHLYV